MKGGRLKERENPIYPGILALRTGRSGLEPLDPRSGTISNAVGLSMTGQRVALFVTSEELFRSHYLLRDAVAKHLPFVLHVTVLPGCDPYRAVSETGCFQFFARNVQEAIDFSIIAQRVAETALIPGMVAQDRILTAETIEPVQLPESELIETYLGRPDDRIASPTPSQTIVFGRQRRRVPELWDVDRPMVCGSTFPPEAQAPLIAAGRRFYADPLDRIVGEAMEEYGRLTGRHYDRLGTYRTDDAAYLLLGEGGVMHQAEAVADYLRATRRIRVGVVHLNIFRPFPVAPLCALLKGRKGVAVLERLDRSLSGDPPLTREVRSLLQRALENGSAERENLPDPGGSVYKTVRDLPPLYTVEIGGGRLEPRDGVGVVENMLPEGGRRRRFYLSVPFVHRGRGTPVQEVQQQTILESYPDVAELTLTGSESPDLSPVGSIAIQLLSSEGGGLRRLGEECVASLFELFEWPVQGRPDAVPLEVGRVGGYEIVVAPEPIRIAPPSFDLVIALDSAAWVDLRCLDRLKEKGSLIVQKRSSIPKVLQKRAYDRGVRLFSIDLAGIVAAESEADSEKEIVQSKVLLGLLLNRLEGVRWEKETKRRIDRWLKERPVQRGFSELAEVPLKGVQEEKGPSPLPTFLKRWPKEAMPMADLHRFWAQTGESYAREGGRPLADPFTGTGVLPAGTGLFRDLSLRRSTSPRWLPEKCTGCGDCWMVCPDSAIPPLVHSIGEICETTLGRLEREGHPIKHLPRALRLLEGELRGRLDRGSESDRFEQHLDAAIQQTVSMSRLPEEEKGELEKEFLLFREEIGSFRFSMTKPFYTEGGGGLLSITVDPDRCKGCMLCVHECPEEALLPEESTEESLDRLRRCWDFWLDLPNTHERHLSFERLGETGAYERLLLDRVAYRSMVGGDETPPGSSERTVLHLFTSTVTAVMRRRAEKHLANLEDLIGRLERHIRLRLAGKFADAEVLHRFLEERGGRPFTLSELAERVDLRRDPIDPGWLQRVTETLQDLRRLQSLFSEGGGRSSLAMVQNVDSESFWSVTYPYTPFVFPWSHHLNGEDVAVAIGLFEGHMRKMAEGFRAIRIAELELSERYNPKVHDDLFKRFGWRDFTEEEYRLTPPVVVVGREREIYSAGLPSLREILSSGIPIKIVVFDALELPPAISLFGMTHPNVYVLQSGMGDRAHLVKGFIEGVSQQRPALFHIFCSQVPAEGIATDAAVEQARLALRSQIYPHFSYNPERGPSWADRLDLNGNPPEGEIEKNYRIKGLNEKGEETLQEVSLTFADFMAIEHPMSGHFKKIPRGAWKRSMVSVVEYLEMDEEERQERIPFVWGVDRQGYLQRFEVSPRLIRCCEERQEFLALLRSLKRLDVTPVDEEEIAEKVRSEMVDRVTRALVELAQGDGGSPSSFLEAIQTDPEVRATK